jgi:hypothetical protein
LNEKEIAEVKEMSMIRRNNSTRLEESYTRYKDQRAKDKYKGNSAKGFHTREFKKCVDYLRTVGDKVEFTGEDLEDMARAAQLTDRQLQAGA